MESKAFNSVQHSCWKLEQSSEFEEKQLCECTAYDLMKRCLFVYFSDLVVLIISEILFFI